jgi:iron(III) transport system ATP-binding protein
MAELQLQGLRRTYANGVTAVDGVDLTVAEGEFMVLVGPSGCGKSTTLRMIAGLETPTSGLLSIGERVVNDVKPADRDIAMVFQSYALYPHMTVAENLAFGLRLRGEPRATIALRVQQAADMLGLTEMLQRQPRALSGGQRQRVALGRALVRQPKVFLLDEPLSNLDAKLREEARAFLRELIVRLGLSALMVTHDQSEAMAISDRILLLNNGKIEQQGVPQSMYETPDTLFTAEFMGSNNKLPAQVLSREGSRATILVDGMQLQGTARGTNTASDTTAIIRVEQVRVSSTQVDNAIKLPLSTCMYLGDRWECLFHQTGTNGINVRAYAPHKLEGGEYWLHLPPESLWVF